MIVTVNTLQTEHQFFCTRRWTEFINNGFREDRQLKMAKLIWFARWVFQKTLPVTFDWYVVVEKCARSCGIRCLRNPSGSSTSGLITCGNQGHCEWESHYWGLFFSELIRRCTESIVSQNAVQLLDQHASEQTTRHDFFQTAIPERIALHTNRLFTGRIFEQMLPKFCLLLTFMF